MAVVDTECSPALPSSQWADEYRAVLAQVILDLHQIQAPTALPPLAPAVPPTHPRVVDDALIGPMVDTMLAAALGRLEAEAAAARVESEVAIAAALRPREHRATVAMPSRSEPDPVVIDLDEPWADGAVDADLFGPDDASQRDRWC